MSECWSLQKKKSDAVVRAVRNPTSTKLQVAVPDSKWTVAAPNDECSVAAPRDSPKEAEPDSIYLPFVSDGFVSLTSDSDAIPVKILRDTGATQSHL